MEALKHTEWTFGIIFFWFALVQIDLASNPTWILVIIVGSQISDFAELLLIRFNISELKARKLTHDYIYVFFIWIFFPLKDYVLLNLFAVALSIHYLVDLFSGLEPIYIASVIFGDRAAILYVTKDHRNTIGRRIEKWGSNYFEPKTEEPTPELAWFWVMQIGGSVFCGLGLLTYLLLV